MTTITPTGPAIRPMADIGTMLRRNLRHAQRYPGLSLGALGMPVIMILLFGLVFGDTFAAGLGGADGGFDYIDFLTPGILLMSIASGTMSPAVAVCMDMTEGIVARFRTMAIFRPAVLTGHVLGNVILTIVSLVLVIGFAVLIGFRPNASFGDWLLAAGLLIAVTIALTWFAIALGLTSKTPEGASNIVLPIALLLPFLSNTFIPLESMPSGIRWFAEYQPFTPIIDTLRHLLLGTPMDSGDGWLALAWCLAIGVVGYFWAQKSYNKGTVA
jgi:ABC-2 type transport system permease protein